MAREDGLAAGVRTRFSSTNQPANRGRKPSKLKKWIRGNGVSNEDFLAIFKNIIATHTIEELQQMVEGDNKNKLPVIVALCISAFIHDMKTGTLTAANSVLDRIMGRPTQQMVFSQKLSDIPEDPKQRQELIEQIENDLAMARPVARELPTPKETEGEGSA
ncbi:MAG: hypothetical protein LBT13_08490 [Treponema sp.]|jgi:hypothetical protein|nr:hypothetical protein [Treponema sp.]